MDFSDKSATKQSFSRKFETGKKLAIKHDNHLKILDNRVALGRLILTIALLATLVSFFDKNQPLVNSIFVFMFLLFCLLSSWYHKQLQNKQKKWSAIVTSYDLSIARIKRQFDLIAKQYSPWHEQNIKVPTGHIYAHDLDIHTHLYALLDTCTTKEGSLKLFQLLLTAGIQPEPLAIVTERSDKAQVISKETTLLRRMEVVKLTENPFQKKEDDVISEKKEQQNFSKNSLFYFMFAIMSIIIWAVILIPALNKYFNQGNTEPLIQGLLTYGLFLILGIYIFSPITKAAEKIAKSSKNIQIISESLRKSNKINNKLDLAFLCNDSLRKIKQLNFLLSLLDLRGNIIFWITMHLFFPFDAILCLLVERKIKKLDKDIIKWENELHYFDLICAFARFKIENPKSRFLSSDERSMPTDQNIVIENIGHPHIPEEKRITNSIKLFFNSPVVLLTGSNMAGKSTFLRTLGTNLLLANMGAPIIADKFRIKPSRILCAIRIDDSLADGTSYFYAEVKRLKIILDALNETNTIPGFFLIDEIFRGTNNKERYIGSYNIILDLFNKKSYGFISTHDLALAEIEKSDNRLVNMHFKEHIAEDKLAFDFKLKDGPCPSTNALYIMRREGLPVPI